MKTINISGLFALCCSVGALLLSGASCKRVQPTPFSPTPLVQEILSDSLSSPHARQLKMYDRGNVQGRITLLGESRQVTRYSEALLGADYFNNIDGSFGKGDALPDFSGEVFAIVMDQANEPYSSYIGEEGKERLLRETVIRNFLMGLDTLYLNNPHDTLTPRVKATSKAFVLCSSIAGGLTKTELDTLRSFSGEMVPIYSAPEAMLEYSYERRRACPSYGSDAPARGMNFLVWTDKDVQAADVYGKLFPRVAASHSDTQSTYMVYSPDSVGTVLSCVKAMLSAFRENAPTGSKVSALLLDDTSVNKEMVDSALVYLKGLDPLSPEGSLGTLLEDGVEVVDPYVAVSFCLYRGMRRSNSFTHRIYYPDLETYVTLPGSGLGEDAYGPDGLFSTVYRSARLPSSSPRADYCLCLLNDDYLDEDFMQFFEEDCPLTFALYVK